MKKVLKVSKEDVLDFARHIYRQALNGYADLEESVCLSETNKFIEDFKDENATAQLSSDLTISPGFYTNSTVTWTSSPQSSYFVSCDPSFNCTIPAESPYNEGFSNPTERQLLLFDSLNSSNIVDLSEVVEETEDDLYDNQTQRIDSNEGHIFL